MGKGNILKEKLARGQCVIGTWCEIPSPEVVNVLAKSGLDFILVDMEHGAMDFRTASQMVVAAEVESTAAIIRVSRNNESDILRSLEIAPAGVMIPHIESESDRIRTVNSTKFPPIGNRSLNPYTRAGGYHFSSDLTKQQNKGILLSLIIESAAAMENAAKIIDDKNVDIIYIGTYDLSMSLGYAGDIQNRIVTKALMKLVKVIRGKNKVAGIMFHSLEEFNLYRKMGIQFLCYKVDTSVIFDEYKKVVNLNR